MKELSRYLPTTEMQAEFEQYKKLKTEAERSEFQETRAKRLEELPDTERKAYVSASLAGLSTTGQDAEELIMTVKLGEIAKAVSLSYIATTYFGKSRSWLYQRLNGHRVNGKQAQFSPEEKRQFALALKNLSIQLQEASLKFG
jgi:isopropylmalate/homocitrate/citramalate synthase